MKKILSLVICIIFFALGGFVIYERYSGEVIFEKVIFEGKTLVTKSIRLSQTESSNFEPITLELKPDMNPIKIYLEYKYKPPRGGIKKNHYSIQFLDSDGAELWTTDTIFRPKASKEKDEISALAKNLMPKTTSTMVKKFEVTELGKYIIRITRGKCDIMEDEVKIHVRAAKAYDK